MTLSAKWVSLFAMIWLIGAWLGSTYDGYNTPSTWVGTGSGGYSTNATTTMNNLMGANVVTSQTPIWGAIPIVGPIANWAVSAFAVATLDFSFLAPYPMIHNIIHAFGLMAILALFGILYGALRGNITIG